MKLIGKLNNKSGYYARMCGSEGTKQIINKELSVLKNKIKYYGRTDIEITPAYASAEEAIADGVEMCLLYEIDEESQTASIVGYHAPNYSDGESSEYDEFKNYTVVIPYEINGYPVTSIGDNAFEEWQHYGYYPPSYEEETLRYNKSAIRNVVLPNGLITRFGSSAFYSSGLEKIKIPKSLKSIGETPFYATSSLTKAEFEYGTTNILPGLFEESYLQEVELPDTVTWIREKAFYNCQLNNVIIPNGVYRIEAEAFGVDADVCEGYNIVFSDKRRTGDFENTYDYDNWLHKDAFLNCKRIYVCQGTAIEEWCKNNNYPIAYTDFVVDDVHVGYADYAYSTGNADSAIFDHYGNEIDMWNTLKKDYNLLGEVEITEDDVAEAGDTGIVGLTVELEECFRDCNYKNLLVKVYIPADSSNSSAGAQLGMSYDEATSLNYKYALLSSQSASYAAITNNRQYITIKAELDSDYIPFYVMYMKDGFGSMAYPSQMYATGSTEKNESVGSYNCISFCSRNKTFKFPAGSKMSVYAR